MQRLRPRRASDEPSGSSEGRSWREWLSKNGLFIAFVLLLVWGAVSSGNFFTTSNLTVILEQSSTVAIVAIPSALLLMAGHVDLSIGSVLGFSAVVVGALYADLQGWAIAVGLSVAIACGLLNGYLSSFRGLSPIIVTLGTLTTLRGLSFVVSDGLPISDFGTAFATLGHGTVATVPVPVVIAAAVVIVGALFLNQTVWGRYVEAIGVNSRASFLSGINVLKIPFWLYVVTAMAAGLAGLIEMSRLDSAPPTMGVNFEIQVLTAILLGGVAFGGGRGSIFGVVIGVLFIATLSNALILNGVQPFWTQVASGVALVVAAFLNVFGQRLSGQRTNRGEGPPPPQLNVGVQS